MSGVETSTHELGGEAGITLPGLPWSTSGIRTHYRRIKSPMLYQMSYRLLHL